MIKYREKKRIKSIAFCNQIKVKSRILPFLPYCFSVFRIPQHSLMYSKHEHRKILYFVFEALFRLMTVHPHLL